MTGALQLGSRFVIGFIAIMDNNVGDSYIKTNH